ncbi:MAG: DUF6788 family protein [Verrucomicrobiota bacterium]
MINSENPLPKTPAELPGTVCEQWKRCGKPACRCASGHPEELHGPYFYRFWREGGRLRKAYVPRDRVAEVRAACEARQARQAFGRRMREKARKRRRRVNELLRELETQMRDL